MATAEHFPTLDERVALTETPVTLDDRPARVTGYRNDFATVTSVSESNDPARSAEWAWPTIARIVAKGGSFQS